MINLNNKIKLIYSLSGTFLTILILTVISITGYSFVQNKNHLFHLSSGVMVKSNDIIYQKISSFLEPATILPKMTAEFIGNEKINHKNNDQIEKYFLTILETYPQFQACFIGLESGDFIMCRRTSQGYQSKIIHRKLNRQLIKTLNKDKIQISIEEKKPDYDPRKRAWYSGALGGKNVFWTKVYTFFTEKAPGVTASHRLSGQVEGVFGIDILLSDLIMFIRKQNLAYKGNIVLLDDKKNVIAASGNLSNLRKLFVERKEVKVSDLNNPLISKAVESYWQKKSEVLSLKEAGNNYQVYTKEISISTDQNWMIMSIIDAKAIFGNVEKTSWNILMYSSLILILAALIIGRVSQLLSKPIQEITDHAEKIQNFDLKNKLHITSSIKEIHLLKEAVSSMQSGLESFKKYVPADLVRQLIQTNQQAMIGAEMKELTILFSDIVQFTKISDQTPPDSLAKYLSDYLDVVARSIKSNQGTIDKYVGDAVMAFWNAPLPDPDHSQNACIAVIEANKRVINFNKKMVEHGLPEMRTRFGVHTGEVVVGNVGSSERLNYTVIGQNVNLTSRLEAINKRYHTSVIISETVYEKVKHLVVARALDKILIKDSSTPLQIYELIDTKKDASDELLEKVKAYEHVRKSYLEHDWKKANQLFSKMSERYPKDYVLSYYTKLSHEFIDSPPDKNWDFVVHVSVK